MEESRGEVRPGPGMHEERRKTSPRLFASPSLHLPVFSSPPARLPGRQQRARAALQHQADRPRPRPQRRLELRLRDVSFALRRFVLRFFSNFKTRPRPRPQRGLKFHLRRLRCFVFYSKSQNHVEVPLRDSRCMLPPSQKKQINTRLRALEQRHGLVRGAGAELFAGAGPRRRRHRRLCAEFGVFEVSELVGLEEFGCSA